MLLFSPRSLAAILTSARPPEMASSISPAVDAQRDRVTISDPVRWVRPPFSTEFIVCTCAAILKDECLCIQAWLGAQQSPISGAQS